MSIKIGIIGGSGLYNMGIIKNAEEIEVETPFGKPSDKLTVGEIEGVQIVFLPRHGRSHIFPPHKVNYRANIYALKEYGVEYLISTAAVGSLKEKIKPCDFVVANQLIDRTFKRETTFFDEGIVAHVSLSDPFCEKLSDIAFKTIKEENLNVHRGTYICIEGPQFSTLAESNLYRSWNVDVIGMTLASEVKLAREAEMCLAGILTVTDYDCWYKEEEKVSVKSVVENLRKNDENMAKIIKKLVSKIRYRRDCECSDALKNAIITPMGLISKKPGVKNLNALLKKYMK